MFPDSLTLFKKYSYSLQLIYYIVLLHTTGVFFVFFVLVLKKNKQKKPLYLSVVSKNDKKAYLNGEFLYVRPHDSADKE